MADSASSGDRRGRGSTRLRFAALSTGIVALAEAAVFIVIFLYQGQFVRARFDDRLALGLEHAAARITPDVLARPGGLAAITEATFDDLVYRDLSLAVFSASGELIESDVEEIATALDRQVGPWMAELDAGVDFMDGTFERRLVGHSRRFRIAARRLAASDETLAVFASTDHIDQMVRTTRDAFLVALPITLVVIAGATWYVAGLILRPIEELRDFAQRLAPDSIPEGIALEPTGPEVEQLQAELVAAMARIDAGYEAQSRFMANVAHELKTPISVVLAQGQTLARDSGERPATREFINSTIEEMRRLGRLVESFLMLTQVREGKAVQLRDVVAVNELLMESIKHCSSMAETYGVALVPTLVDSDDEALVSGDADLIRTAIDNLVRNAIRFSRSGDRIDLAARDAGTAWAVEVRDRGPGIPPELVDRIFDRFAQARDEERLGRGSGLGLEIAQGIAELHGGEIAVFNESPGCRFVLSLPKATRS